MINSENERFIEDIEVDSDMNVGRPFKVQEKQNRRFVRLEILAPVEVSVIKDGVGNFCPSGEGTTFVGRLLNVSAGGCLVESETELECGDIIAMRMCIQNDEAIGNILAIVKRCEDLDGIHLAGVEYSNRKELVDCMSQAEIDLLPDELGNFQDSVHDVLLKYVPKSEIKEAVRSK